MANKVVENKILKLSIDDASLKKGLSNALSGIKGLQNGLNSVKSKNLDNVGTSATTLGSKISSLVSKIPIFGSMASSISGVGDKLGGLTSKIPIVGDVASSISKIGTSADSSSSSLSRLGSGVSLSGINSTASTAASSIISVGSAADESSQKLGVMDTALGVLAGNMMTKGAEMISKAFGVATQGLRDGFSEYELKMNSVQTIMSNTAQHGTTIQEVTHYLDELNAYADKTIYNFGDMTNAVGKFTTTGMQIEEATMNVQGLANAAAHAGANSTQLSQAMPQVAQALSAGFFQLQDWRSIESASMSTDTLRKTLIKYGKDFGTITEEMEVTSENFRTTLTDNKWLTAEVWSAAMAEYADTNTELGAAAQAAAQEIKTFSQLLDTTREGIQSGWAKTWELVFGDFEEAKANWSVIGDIVGGIVNFFADGRNAIFQEWHDLGGYRDLWDGIINIVEAFGAVFDSIGIAFRNVFGEATPGVGILLALTAGFRRLTEYIKPGTKGFETLTAVFEVFFTLAKSVGSILKVIVKAAFVPLKAVLGGLSVVLTAAAKGIEILASWLVRLLTPASKALEVISSFAGKGLSLVGTVIESFFAGLSGKTSDVLDGFASKANKVGDSIKKVFENARNGKDAADGLNIFEYAIRGVVTIVDSLKSKFENLGRIFDVLSGAIKGAKNPIQSVHDTLGKLGDGRGRWLDAIYDLTKGFLEAGNASFKAKGMMQEFGDAIGDFVNTIKSKWKAFTSDFMSFFDNSGTTIPKAAEEFGQGTGSRIVKGLILGVASIPVALGAAVIGGLSKVFPQVGEWADGMASKLFNLKAFKDFNITEAIFGTKVSADEFGIGDGKQVKKGLEVVRLELKDMVSDAKAGSNYMKQIGGELPKTFTNKEVEQFNSSLKKLGINAKLSNSELTALWLDNSSKWASTKDMLADIENVANQGSDSVKRIWQDNVKEMGFAKGTLTTLGAALKKVGSSIKSGLNFDLLRKGLDGTASKAELAQSKMASLGKFLKDKLKIDIEGLDRVIAQVKENIARNFSSLPKIFSTVTSSFKNFFSNLDFSSKTALIKSFVGEIGKWFESLGKFIEQVSSPVAAVLKVFAQGLGDISRGLEGSSLMNVGIVAVIWKLLNILDGGSSILEKFTSPFTELIEKIGNFGQAKSILQESANAIKAFGKQAKAKALVDVGKGIALVAASLFVLSLIPTDRMVPALLTLAGAVTILTGAFVAIKWALDRFGGGGGRGTASITLDGVLDSIGFPEFKKMLNSISKATMMTAVASSVLMVAWSMKEIKDLSWEEIAKGLVVAGTTMLLLVSMVRIAGKGATLGDAGKILAMAFVVKMMVGLIDAINEIEWNAIGKALIVITGLAAVIALAVALVSGKARVKGVQIKWGTVNMGTAAVVLAIAYTIKMMVGLIDKINLLEWSAIGKAMTVIILLATVLTLAIALMGGEGTVKGIKLKWGSVKLSTAVTVLAMAAAITIIAGSMMLLSTIPVGKLLAASVVITVLSLVLAVAIGFMGGELKTANGTKVSFNNIKLTQVLGIIVMVGGIMLMAAAVAGLSFLDQGKLWSALAVLTVISVVLVVGFAAVLAAFKYLSDPDATDVAMLIVYTLSLILLSGTIMKLSNVPWEGISKSIVAMGTVILGMIAVIWMSKGVGITQVAVIAATGLALWAVAQQMVQFTTIPWEGIKQAMLSMVVVVASMVVLMLAAQGGDLMGILTMGVATLAIMGVGYTLKELATMEGDLIQAGLALGAILIATAIMMQISGNGAGLMGMVALVGASVAILGIAFALKQLSEISGPDMLVAVLGLAAALAVIGVAGAALVYTGAIAGILGLAAAALAFGAAAMMFGAGANLVVQALTGLYNLIKTIITDITSLFSFLADGIGKGLSALPGVLGKIWDGLGKFFGKLPEKAIEWGGKILKGLGEGIAGAVGWLGEKLGGVWDSITGFFTGKEPEAKEKGKKTGESLAKGIEESKTTVGESAKGMMGGLDEALSGFDITAKAKGEGIGAAFGQGIAGQAGQVGLDTSALTAAMDGEMFNAETLAGLNGSDLGKVFGQGIAGQAGQVGLDTSAVTDASKSKMDGLTKESGGIGEKAADNFGKGVESKKGDVEAKAGKVSDGVKSKWDKVDLSSSGRSIAESFGRGIEGAVGWVTKKASGLIDAVRRFFPNSPAKEGPLSGAGWRKLARSGGEFARQWGSGIGSAASEVMGEASNLVSSVTDVMDEISQYDLDQMSLNPTITPVVDMTQLNQLKEFNLDSAVHIKNAQLDTAYANMNARVAQISQQQKHIDIMTRGMQIMTDKLTSLIDVNEHQTKAIERGHVVTTVIDGYDMSKRLAPTMIDAQRDYQSRVDRLGGVIKPI